MQHATTAMFAIAASALVAVTPMWGLIPAALIVYGRILRAEKVQRDMLRAARV